MIYPALLLASLGFAVLDRSAYAFQLGNKVESRLKFQIFAHKWSPGDIVQGSNFLPKTKSKFTLKAVPPIEVKPTEYVPTPVNIAPIITAKAMDTPITPITIPDVIEQTHTPVASTTKTFDGLAALSYVGATATQWTLAVSFLHLIQLKVLPFLQNLVAKNTKLPTQLPTAFVSFLFLFFSLRSRVFSPLDNSRPAASAEDPVFKERLRPWWQPPPLAFPIIWSTIALLRAASSVLIWKTTNTLLCLPIFAFIAHLSIGDTWNTINNVEKRLGTSVLGVLFVLASVYNVVHLYYLTNPLAGKLLAPSAIWISIATFLIYSIWRLNSQLFGRPSLLPSKEEGPACKWRLPFASFNK